jgi:hypothetical protein
MGIFADYDSLQGDPGLLPFAFKGKRRGGRGLGITIAGIVNRDRHWRRIQRHWLISMADRTNEEKDLALVQELVGGPAGFSLERIEAVPQERRPDFRMVSWRGLVGYCEVKSPRDDWLDEQLELAPSGTIVGGARPDPTFNRIARHIEKAVTQFDTVNPDRSLPNVLVFVNHDDHASFNDLYETVTGYARAQSGERYPFHMHLADNA